MHHLSLGPASTYVPKTQNQKIALRPVKRYRLFQLDYSGGSAGIAWNEINAQAEVGALPVEPSWLHVVATF